MVISGPGSVSTVPSASSPIRIHLANSEIKTLLNIKFFNRRTRLHALQDPEAVHLEPAPP
jgi:hypothetical protein